MSCLFVDLKVSPKVANLPRRQILGLYRIGSLATNLETMLEMHPQPLSFPLFAHLPQELRDLIWYFALPERSDSALYIYKPCNWILRRLTEGDDGYYESDDTLNLDLIFRDDLIDPVYFELPMAFVSHEARRIALAWTRKHDIKMQRTRGKIYPCCIQPFDAQSDALYISTKKWHEFLSESIERGFEPDLLGRQHGVVSDINHIAISEEVLRYQTEELAEIFVSHQNVHTILVVVDASSDLESAYTLREPGQSQWKYEPMEDSKLVWDCNKAVFMFERDASSELHRSRKLLEEVKEQLNNSMQQPHTEPQELEIRLVSAYRKQLDSTSLVG
ncbi:hypothetical protein BU24DRAFT_449734 [Aaosphaeria arxii CBS 175.79]|uniref:2EXR domain-containing protein n=1 Tax=Aaosphaeria arxii CBS 175.79 TaxID=1450172 RepID=A0A6A5XYJ9_9PLEO|nr:uncharacterized protein BU24DRAFT_449734 [Aaosphaeria arxii CBS 175.79]KAF2018242.1 hypothetical protein BU24DRAFT_449734 [Aaosphaeria arxii CBS 175.79]